MLGKCKNGRNPEENESEAHGCSCVLGQGTQEQDEGPTEEEAQVSVLLASSSENRHTKDSKAESTMLEEQRRMKERSTVDTPSSSKKKKRPLGRALLRSLLFIDHTQIALVPPVSTFLEPAK